MAIVLLCLMLPWFLTHSDLVVFRVWLTMFCMMNGCSLNNMLYVCFSFMNICVVCVSAVYTCICCACICGSCIGGLCVQNSISFNLYWQPNGKPKRFSQLHWCFSNFKLEQGMGNFIFIFIFCWSIFSGISFHLKKFLSGWMLRWSILACQMASDQVGNIQNGVKTN